MAYRDFVVLNKVQNKTRALEDISSRNNERSGDHDLALREKDEEIEVYKSGMEQALMELEELKLVSTNVRMIHTLAVLTKDCSSTEPR